MSWQRVVAGVVFGGGYWICHDRLGLWETTGIALMIFGALIFSVGWKRVVKGDDVVREKV